MNAKRHKPRKTQPIKFGGLPRRSYVLDRDEVIDYRTGKTARASDVLEGKLEALVEIPSATFDEKPKERS